MVILIAGDKRSGKDTVAKIIAKNLSKTKTYHFADAMKFIISRTFDITLSELEYAKNNGKLKTFLKYKRLVFLVVDFRKILQRFGTEGMKPIFGEGVWRKIVEKNLKEDYVNIIPDYRFPIEKIEGAITIRVNRSILKRHCVSDTHVSENALRDTKMDYTINNNGTFKDLELSVEKILQEIYM